MFASIFIEKGFSIIYTTAKNIYINFIWIKYELLINIRKSNFDLI